jgi:dGTPase
LIPAGYSESDIERFISEDRSSSIKRGEFARDRARILHSSALRRLGAKTQVLSPTGGDFARTRLTHSLEVAQVGREMALSLGLDPDLVDTACLAHDLGHPPFGHNGEKALNYWSEEIGGFEGNAQTLRVLSRIEPKIIEPGNISRGLNLTRASLDASCKYPWSRFDGKPEPGGDQSIKFGFYEDDREVFEFLRQGSEEKRKCIEAEVMDFADDVAYSVHDFEDAIVAKFIKLEEIHRDNNDLYTKIENWTGSEVSRAELETAFMRLRSGQYWLQSFDGSLRNQATLKNLTSQIIGSFVSRTTELTIGSAASASLVRYSGRLVVPADVKAEIAVLKGVVSAYLMNQENRQPFYQRQREVLVELADSLLARNGAYLDEPFASLFSSSRDEATKRRVIVDQVASLTDISATALHEKLTSN